jgi:hypothetical protein
MQTVDAVRDQVKSELVQQFSTMVDGLFELAMADASPRELEEATWEKLLVEGAGALGALLADRAGCDPFLLTRTQAARGGGSPTRSIS